MAIEREIVATVPRLVIQHKATALPAAMVKPQPNPQGKTQDGTPSYPICSGPGGKHKTHMYQVWHTNLLQGKQYPQANAGKAQGPGP